MATHKGASIRYRVIDRCLRDRQKRFTFKDLQAEINLALAEEYPHTDGIQERQLREDLRFMKKENVFNAPIDSYREGNSYYYHYTDKDFSIAQKPISNSELEQLKIALQVMKRFEGATEFEWITEVNSLIENKFDVQPDEKSILGYDTNMDYAGFVHIGPLFHAIRQKRVLHLVYKPFGKDDIEFIFHPYYLKQFNNRWFVFGYNEAKNVATWNVPLDRIVHIEHSTETYIEDETNWEDYFSDIIGVTKNPEKVEIVVLEFQAGAADYVLTKPLHQTQKKTFLENGNVQIRIQVIPNYELETLILGFGEKVKVIGPESLKTQIKNRIFEMHILE